MNQSVMIELSKIDRNRYQIRDALDQARVEELAAVFDRLPPIIVQALPEGRFAVLDGSHRIAAATRNALTEIAAVVHEIDDNAAFEIAVMANATGCLPLKTKERKRLAREMLKRFTAYSNNRIAEAVGISCHTVIDIRAEMETTLQIAKLDRTIGKDNKERPAEMPKPAPAPIALPYTIHCADARNMHTLSIPPAQLVVTSPPYNVGIGYAEHDDNMTPADALAQPALAETPAADGTIAQLSMDETGD